MEKTSYKTVIFDMDGTLVDSLRGIAYSMNNVLKNVGLQQFALEDYRNFVGAGMEQLIKRALNKSHADQELFNKCYLLLKQEYSESWRRASKLYDGISVLLDETAARGIQIAILSNKPDKYLRQFVDHFLPSWDIYPVIGASDTRLNKPDPGSALEIAGATESEPKEIVFVGDSSIDMETAANAGMVSVGVSWGYGPAEELESSGANHIIDHPSELLNII